MNLDRYRLWPEPARTMATASNSALDAVADADADAFAAAAAELARLDQDQVALLLGAVTRELLERSHPDGLDADDVNEVVRRCAQAAVLWYEPLDAPTLVLALIGALGVGDPDESPVTDRAALIAHGLLLISDLLAAARVPVSAALESALTKLRRDQTVELP